MSQYMVDIEFRRHEGELQYRKLMAPTGLPLKYATWTAWATIVDEAINEVTR